MSGWTVSAQTPPAGARSETQEEIPSPEEMRVKNLSLSGDEPGSITLTWDPPEIYSFTYQIYWTDSIGHRPSGGHTGYIYRFPDETSYTLTGLAHGEVYNIRMQAVFDSGRTRGPVSSGSVRSGGGQGRAITGLTITEVDFEKAEVTWGQPSQTPISYQLFSPDSDVPLGRSNPDTFKPTGPHSLWLRNYLKTLDQVQDLG